MLEAMELADGESGREKEEADETESVAGESREDGKPERKRKRMKMRKIKMRKMKRKTKMKSKKENRGRWGNQSGTITFTGSSIAIVTKRTFIAQKI